MQDFRDLKVWRKLEDRVIEVKRMLASLMQTLKVNNQELIADS